MTDRALPILYSFRRCPYAIRARMAIVYAGIEVELREVSLKEKPAAMLEASPKATVPVLVLPGGDVLEESLDVMHWALEQADPERWRKRSLAELTSALVSHNDEVFKHWLDRYKYSVGYPDFPQEHYRDQCETTLKQLEERLTCDRFLLSNQISLADVAVFPFIRQFCFVDEAWFKQSSYPLLRHWLEEMLKTPLFIRAMHKHPLWEPDPAKPAQVVTV